MEERKFLDLDHVCDQILNEYDRKMFREAIRCYQIDSNRAAVILAWSVTADCLFRRIEELAADNDGQAQKARTALSHADGTARYEEVLIVQAKICDLIDDYEEKSLRFARDTRSKCAHPTGVIPSAEAVRHILHICSQTVLCRSGYRGITFVKNLVGTKLKDRHLFSNKQRIKDDCCYYIEKVSERVSVQFGTEIAKCFTSNDPIWLENTFTFLQHIFSLSSIDLSKKIAAKLQAIESKDRPSFSIIAGLSEYQGVWDTQEIHQSKAHLRDSLKVGKVNDFVFKSYGNLCALSQLEEEDVTLLKSRFGLLIEHIAEHTFLQNQCGSSLILLVIDALGDEYNIQEQILKGISVFSSLPIIFKDDSTNESTKFIDALIQADWRNADIANTWQRVSSWSSTLLISLLNLAERFLLECSDDSPDDILAVFEAANKIMLDSPSLMPSSFEETIKKIIESEINPDWYGENNETHRNFIGQVNLLKIKYSTYFPLISQLDIPSLEELEEVADEF